MKKPSKRATTLRKDRRPLIRIPVYEKLRDNDIIDRGDVWAVTGGNPNLHMTTMINASKHEFGRTVKSCLESATGGVFWRITKLEKQEPSPLVKSTASP